jgi:hypothetical protein
LARLVRSFVRSEQAANWKQDRRLDARFYAVIVGRSSFGKKAPIDRIHTHRFDGSTTKHSIATAALPVTAGEGEQNGAFLSLRFQRPRLVFAR